MQLAQEIIGLKTMSQWTREPHDLVEAHAMVANVFSRGILSTSRSSDKGRFMEDGSTKKVFTKVL